MIRRIVVVSAAAVVAGTAAALGLAAAADAWLGYSTPVLVALAAVFLAQTALTRRRGRRLTPAQQQWRCHGKALWFGRVRHHRHPAVSRPGETL